MGIVILIILIGIEGVLLIWSIGSKNNHREERSIIRIAELLFVGSLLLGGVLVWGFRYFMLLFVLMVLGIRSIIILLNLRRKQKPYQLNRSIISFISYGMVFGFSLFPSILFPQYQQPQATGDYRVETAKYTWVDESRKEEFSKENENRALTVEFWYPEKGDSTYPLLVFSHGAFGFSGSNYSTFALLASNGYVVASIGHTYHAFFTSDTNGKLTIANIDFLNAVMSQNNTDYDPQEFENTQKWMKLRVDDENFVLDTILENTKKANSGTLFSLINGNKIGLFGHSLGGASSAQLGRIREDIDAVISLDGTMLGEQLAFENGKPVLNDTPYPVPLLNIYSGSLYNRAKQMMGEEFDNFHAAKNAVCAYEIVFEEAGHLNFTDLPLFSPVLAKLLGVGTADPGSCIEKTNEVVLEFFDCYLKEGGIPPKLPSKVRPTEKEY